MTEHAAIVLSAIGLFITWSVSLITAVYWLAGKFADLELSLQRHLPIEDYEKNHQTLQRRVGILERWATRLNGSVKVNFNSVSERDFLSD